MPKNDDVFIKYYETIRRMLHQLFVYGCYDRSQGARRQVTSDRSYSTNIRRIQYFWPKNLTADRAATKKKIHHFPLTASAAQGNFLARSYEIKAFHAQDLNLYIFLLSALADGRPQTAAMLVDNVKENVFTDYSETDCKKAHAAGEAPVYYPMVRDKLNEMASCGLLCKDQSAKSVRYRIADDVLSRLTPDELSSLDEAVMKYRDRLPLAALAYGAQRAIEGTISCGFGDDPPPAVPPEREGVFYQSILDDEIAFLILSAIEHHHKISFSVDRDARSPRRGVTPVRILRDMVYGRQYLLAQTAGGRAFIRRLDLIHGLEETDEPFLPSKAESALAVLPSIWCASLDDACTSDAPMDVVILFLFDDTPASTRVKERLLREQRQGTIDRQSSHCWLYRIAVYDPVEMIPWIRTYGRYATVQAPAFLRERLERDAARLRASDAAGDFAFDTPSRRAELPGATFPAHETPFFCEFRNAYFFATLELYDRMILGGESFTADDLLHELARIAFPLPMEPGSRDLCAQDITTFSPNIHRAALFRTLPDGRLVPSYGYAPADTDDPAVYGQPLPFLLTMLEKRWLMSLLDEPAARSALGYGLVQKLRGLLACEPFPFTKYVLARGVSAPAPATADGSTTAIHLLIQSIHGWNEVERAFLLFSTWEKEGWLDDATGRYHLIVHAYPGETAILVEKLLSLGPSILVLAPAPIKKAVLAALPS